MRCSTWHPSAQDADLPNSTEVVIESVNGEPMVVHRPSAQAELNLRVRAEGAYVLCYRVTQGSKVLGEGRMTLVEDGKAWVDLVWPAGKPEAAREVVYVKAKA